VAKLRVPEPFSGGILLSYRCTNECRHCMYACSPRWNPDWMNPGDAERVLAQLSTIFARRYPPGFDQLGVNIGLHFTGGEPFLNFQLLLGLVKTAARLGIPSTFVETNCFWCLEDEATEAKLQALKDAGLKGILISANPFVVEQVPFERIERAVRIAGRVFGGRTMVYQELFLGQMRSLGVSGTLPFEDYLRRMAEKDAVSLRAGLSFPSILPMARAAYRLGHLYQRHPAERFFSESCREDLTRDWHIHVDNYMNYIPGYCAGLSLGDARDIALICQGIELDDHPIIQRLVAHRGIERLFRFGVEGFGYRELKEGYVSKCHLCIDIRRHIAERTGEFKELKPRELYSHL